MKKLTPSQINIPLPGGKFVIGSKLHDIWFSGERFLYEGNRYEFIGKDTVGGLHCRAIDDGGRLAVFESSRHWEGYNAKALPVA